MKQVLYLGSFLVLGALSCTAQTTKLNLTKLDLTKLHVGSLAPTASKAQITKYLGHSPTVVDPHYECGEYASQPGEQKFYQLRYPQAVFIGNGRAGYELESFDFKSAGPGRLAYGQQPLSAATTLAEFKRRFGPLESYRQPDGSVEVIVRQEDATAAFFFRAGRLARYEFHGVGC